MLSRYRKGTQFDFFKRNFILFTLNKKTDESLHQFCQY